MATTERPESTRTPLGATLRALAQSTNDQRALKTTWEVNNEAHVREVRAAGGSWSDVGRAMGMSKQAAQQRYGA